MIKTIKKFLYTLAVAVTLFSVAVVSACATVEEHSHAYPSNWKLDEDEHWHSCIECGYEARAEHSYYNGVCRICGYKNEYALNLAYEGVYEGETLVSYAVSGVGECKDNSVKIPKNYNSLPVTAINAEAFKGVTTLFSISVPSSVEVIGDYAFQSCSSLETITLPNGVRTIGKSTFASCTSLKSITLPDSVISLGASAFSNCSKLVNLGISGGLTLLDATVFMGCTALESVKIPDGVERVSSLAFQNCSNLKTVEFGAGVKDIDGQAFANCAKLQTLTVSSGNAFYRSKNDCVVEKATEKLVLVANLPSVTVPSGVVTIGGFAFFNCTAVEEIRLPASLERVEPSAFARCAGLARVSFAAGAEKWNTIEFGNGNDFLTGAQKIFNA